MLINNLVDEYRLMHRVIDLCRVGRLPDYIGAEVNPMKNQSIFRHVDYALREDVAGDPTKGCLILM